MDRLALSQDFCKFLGRVIVLPLSDNFCSLQANAGVSKVWRQNDLYKRLFLR